MLAEHQREAVTRALTLLRTYGGVLLADEVGLGKSYVAAEVAREESARGATIELIVPAALVAQWRMTLDLFDVSARILTHDALASDPFVAQPQPRLVIVDEAHAFRNPATRRYAALARRGVAARMLLVTATPVCNGIADLEALIRLLARDDLLATAGVPSIDYAFASKDAEAIERIVAALVIRRERDVLPPELHFGALERHVIRHRVPAAPHIDELQFPLIGANAAMLRTFLRRRLESSEAALLESIRRQLRFYTRALDCLAAGRTLPKREYRRAFGGEEDRDAFQQVLFWELFAPAGGGDVQAIEDEVARLHALSLNIETSPCTKRAMLLDLAANTREPMLIFTSSAATACDLFDALKSAHRCGLVTSRERSRDAVLRAFLDARLDLVISTDLASEGLNLQRAGAVVHYDIPWNPVKLDQRNGRAHRIGQTRAAVRAIYFLPEHDDTGVMATVAKKNRVRRRALRASASETTVPTLRPRLTRDAAAVRFLRAAERAGLTAPESLARRHKAGIEQLLDAMSREYLDARRIEELAALIAAEH
ncbi:MAG TPA: DEAD/DEAH box helicase [Thermoanaerobaculia bacterium]|nr:DEAD/DEAH box helicase [Thermoanaerobaculia bacterium]